MAKSLYQSDILCNANVLLLRTVRLRILRSYAEIKQVVFRERLTTIINIIVHVFVIIFAWEIALYQLTAECAHLYEIWILGPLSCIRKIIMIIYTANMLMYITSFGTNVYRQYNYSVVSLILSYFRERKNKEKQG